MSRYSRIGLKFRLGHHSRIHRGIVWLPVTTHWRRSDYHLRLSPAKPDRWTPILEDQAKQYIAPLEDFILTIKSQFYFPNFPPPVDGKGIQRVRSDPSVHFACSCVFKGIQDCHHKSIQISDCLTPEQWHEFDYLVGRVSNDSDYWVFDRLEELEEEFRRNVCSHHE